MTEATRKMLEELLEEGRRLRGTAYMPKGVIAAQEYIPDKEALQRWVAISARVIEHIAGTDSWFHSEFKRVTREHPRADDLGRGIAVLQAFADAWDTGLLRSRELLISSELFEDSLDLADYLLAKGYKDPAAVVVGAVLESALRKMCGLRNVTLGGREPSNPSTSRSRSMTHHPTTQPCRSR